MHYSATDVDTEATSAAAAVAISLAGVVRPEPEGGESESVCSASEHRTDVKQKKKSSTPVGAAAYKTAVQLDELPKERKVAFHEKLILELSAMHPSPVAATALRPPEETTTEMKRRSSDSPDRSSASPNGSHRSRIRTADWIEVGDNGKQMVFSSCQISLEDSGLEDEMERLEETSSSGAGDSWDSVIDHEERYLLFLLLPYAIDSVLRSIRSV